MIDVKRSQQLTQVEITEIQRMARAKLNECKKTQDVIGNQIFSILSLNARVFFYPLGEKEPWGITYMWGMNNTSHADKPFVVINTSIPSDAQVFAAAHELYHIWSDKKTEATPSPIVVETDDNNIIFNISELKANRFAAEFLVDEELLKQEMKIYSIYTGNIQLKDILSLSSHFNVPYKTMVKRLYEVGAISKADRDEHLLISEHKLNELRIRFSLQTLPADNRVSIDNLVELAVLAYEQKKITYEKLQYLLSISELEPSDVGIEEPASITFLTDDILDSIMEE